MLSVLWAYGFKRHKNTGSHTVEGCSMI